MLGHKIVDHTAEFRLVGAEALKDQTEEGEQPDNADQDQHDIGNGKSDSFLMCHYWNPSSSLTDGRTLYTTREITAVTMNTMIPMTAAVL